MKRKVQILAAVLVILASAANADPLSDWPHWERNPSVCQARNASSSWATHGDPVVTGSASPFSTKYDDDVTVATPRGTFVLTRSFVGSRDALGQTDSKSTDSACRGGVVGDRYPGLLKAPFGPNFVPTRSTTQGDLITPLTIHNLTSIVDTRCSEYTRVLTPQGDTRFFGVAPTVANGQQAWVPRASRAAGEPSRLRVRRSAGGALSFDWFPEGGMRYVFDSVFAASGPNGQYRLTQAYLDDGALFFDVTYAYPLLDPGDPGSSTVKADGGVKPYMWNEPLPGCVTCGSGEVCDVGNVCRAACGSQGATQCTAFGYTFCTNLQVDALNCGACGVACDVNQYCTAGTCLAPPAACLASLEPYLINFPETNLKVRFIYTNPPSIIDAAEWTNSECVLKRVEVMNGSNVETAVNYAYATTKPFGQTMPFATSALVRTSFAVDGGANAWFIDQESFSNTGFLDSSGGWSRGFTAERAGEGSPSPPLVVDNRENTVIHTVLNGQVVLGEDFIPGAVTSDFYDQQFDLQACTNCCSAQAYSRSAYTRHVTTSGWTDPGKLKSTFMSFYGGVLEDGGLSESWNSLFGPLPAKRVEACIPSSEWCTAGQTNFIYGQAGTSSAAPEPNQCAATNRPVVEVARSDRMGVFNQSNTVLNVSNGAFELKSVSSGATAAVGGDPLATTAFTYDYGDQQRLSVEEETSVLGGTASTYVVRSSTGRITSVVRAGETIVEGHQTTQLIATFFRTGTRPCSQLGETSGSERITAVEGPCLVNSVNDTACSSFQIVRGGVTFTQLAPLTEYFYYGGTIPPSGLHETASNAFNSGRVSMINSFAGNCQVALRTQFGSYSASGAPGFVEDPNQKMTTVTHEGGFPTRTVLPTGSEYVMEWDRGRLERVRRPEGDSTLFCTEPWLPISGWYPRCHRGNPDVPNNVPNSNFLHDKLAWTADIGNVGWPQTATVIRVATQTWERDGVASREIGGAPFIYNNFPVFTKSTSQIDLESRTLSSTVGVSTDWWSSQRFDPESRVTARGAGIELALGGNPSQEANCRESSVDNPKCTYFTRDRLGRMTEARSPYDNVSTCFAYDAQGNISVVARGCNPMACTTNEVTSVAGGEVIGGPACGERAEYIWDDFGNLVAMRRQIGQAWATTTYEYTPAGDLIVRQTEQQRAAGEFSGTLYDRARRPVQTKTVHSGQSLTLTSRTWDTAPSIPANCTSDISSSIAARNVKGRVGYEEDPVWRTWFAYDAVGRKTVEKRVRMGAEGTDGCANNQPNFVSSSTRYTYTPNGNLSDLYYPHGRRVQYRYPTDGTKDNNLPIGIAVQLFHAETSALVDVITDVAWTPDKRLSSYRHHNVAALSGQTPIFDTHTRVTFSYSSGLTEPFESCFQDIGESNDFSGRLSRILVVDDTTDQPLYERIYRWRADQVVGVDVCYQDQKWPVRLIDIPYGEISQQKALLSNAATGSVDDNISTASAMTYTNVGEQQQRSFSSTGYSWFFEQQPGGLQASMWAGGSAPSSGSLGYKLFTWDADGRQVARTSAPEYDLVTPNNVMNLSFPLSETQASGGVDSVLRTVDLAGSTAGQSFDVFFNYFYNSSNKRTRKTYPNGATEDFFYGLNNELLSERSFEFVTDVDEVAALDEYVYLGGMPVISILGQLSQATRTRMSDFSTGWCIRRGVERQCGMHQIVSDYQGTPIVVFNQKNRVTGVGEYDLFGHRNRISLPAVESSHPASTTQIMASQIGRANAGIQTFVRLRVSYLDSSPVGWFDTPPQVAIRGTGSSTTLSTAVGVFPSVVTQFHPGTMFDAVFVPGTTTSRGAALDSYEFERLTDHPSVARYFPPLRFPGQYYDEETDFHENWNRFYDPTTGRYLSPEPLLQLPTFIRRLGRNGLPTPTYAYAANNSLRYSDASGLDLHVAWSNYLFYDDEKLKKIERIVNELNNPTGDCACALKAQNDGADPPWKNRWISVVLDPYERWKGRYGSSNIAQGIIYVDPDLSFDIMKGTIAHEGGHFIFPYASRHGKDYFGEGVSREKRFAPDEQRKFNNPDFHCGGKNSIQDLHPVPCSCD